MMLRHLPPLDAASPAADTCEHPHITAEFVRLSGQSRMGLARNRAGVASLLLLESADAAGFATIERGLALVRYGSSGDVDK